VNVGPGVCVELGDIELDEIELDEIAPDEIALGEIPIVVGGPGVAESAPQPLVRRMTAMIENRGICLYLTLPLISSY
jgi:hypothetical protein